MSSDLDVNVISHAPKMADDGYVNSLQPPHRIHNGKKKQKRKKKEEAKEEKGGKIRSLKQTY